MPTRFWQPPRVRRDGDSGGERRATWLELFCDLIFVAAIGQLAHGLSAHLTGTGLLEFVAFYVPLWWCWVGATFYATRFDSDTVLDRLFTFAQMGIVAAMAVNIHHGLVESSAGFALCYAAFRGLLIGQYLIAGYFIPEARLLVNRFGLGFGLSVSLWFISAFVPAPFRFVLWILGLVIDFVTPLMARKAVVQLPPSLTHIPERVGLFTIIVLGESIIGVVNGLAALDWSAQSILTAILGLVTTCSLWWLYFDSADGSPLQSVKKGNIRTGLLWLYAHLPLTLGLTATGVGIEHLVEDNTTVAPEVAERWLVCGAVALCLVILAGLHWMTCTLGTPQFRKILSTYRLGSAAFVLVIAIAGTFLSAIGLASLIAIACALQVVFDLSRQVGRAEGAQ